MQEFGQTHFILPVNVVKSFRYMVTVLTPVRPTTRSKLFAKVCLRLNT